jgi:hypothetical protein
MRTPFYTISKDNNYPTVINARRGGIITTSPTQVPVDKYNPSISYRKGDSDDQ